MRILTILASIVGVLSLFANIALGYTTYTLNLQKNTLQERLNERIRAYNDQVTILDSVKSSLVAANYQNELLTADVKAAKAETNTYRDRASKAEYFVDRAKCYAMVDENKAYAATTNAGVKPSVINALERMYDGSVQSSSFTTYWDNRKSALLTAFWGDGTSKTVLSWDSSGDLKTVYDVGAGCVMYTR
jgi:hypothetical protein